MCLLKDIEVVGEMIPLEKAGYDCYTLNTLRRYVEALGNDFRLEVAIKRA